MCIYIQTRSDPAQFAAGSEWANRFAPLSEGRKPSFPSEPFLGPYLGKNWLELTGKQDDDDEEDG